MLCGLVRLRHEQSGSGKQCVVDHNAIGRIGHFPILTCGKRVCLTKIAIILDQIVCHLIVLDMQIIGGPVAVLMPKAKITVESCSLEHFSHDGVASIAFDLSLKLVQL